MARWHHRLDGHEFEQSPRVGDGQAILVCCSPWDCKELDTTEQLIYEISSFKFLYNSAVFLYSRYESFGGLTHYKYLLSACHICHPLQI